MNQPKAPEEKRGLEGRDKRQDDLVDGGPQKLPEGLTRQRQGALDKNAGRGNEGQKDKP